MSELVAPGVRFVSEPRDRDRCAYVYQRSGYPCGASRIAHEGNDEKVGPRTWRHKWVEPTLVNRVRMSMRFVARVRGALNV